MSDFRRILRLQTRVEALEEGGGGGGSDPLELVHYLSVGASPAQSGDFRVASDFTLVGASEADGTSGYAGGDQSLLKWVRLTSPDAPGDGEWNALRLFGGGGPLSPIYIDPYWNGIVGQVFFAGTTVGYENDPDIFTQSAYSAFAVNGAIVHGAPDTPRVRTAHYFDRFAIYEDNDSYTELTSDYLTIGEDNIRLEWNDVSTLVKLTALPAADTSVTGQVYTMTAAEVAAELDTPTGVKFLAVSQG